jgi:hypothetical protein
MKTIHNVILCQVVVEEIAVRYRLIRRDDHKACGDEHIWQYLFDDAIMPLIGAHR